MKKTSFGRENVLSASLNDTDWNFRIFASRPITVKDKSEQVRKIVATDLTSALTFSLEVPQEISLESVETPKEYQATFKVYTLKNTKGVEEKYIEFFEVLDVDQSVEDFIKIFWVYPKNVKFILSELEEI
jgi:hypothetical protein